jgi:hypothetical protein
MNDTPEYSLKNEQIKNTESKAYTVDFEACEDMNCWSLPNSETVPSGSNNSSANQQGRSLEDYDQLRVTKEKPISVGTPTVSIGCAAFASPGNISAISGASKSGKTALATVILAGAISATGKIHGFQEIQVVPNKHGSAVIHFDTEQSEADQQALIGTILRRSDLTATPDYLRSYNIRQISIEDYRPFTEDICELSRKRFRGIHMICIDGGADYITCANDEVQARMIIEFFTHLSIKYACPVIILVHLNPGSDKERGHFGSIVQRKCYGLVSITKKGEISTIQAKYMRRADISKIADIRFAYNCDKGYHIEVDTALAAVQGNDSKKERLKSIVDEVFLPIDAYRHTVLVTQIMKVTERKIGTAKKLLGEMVEMGFVVLGPDKNYRLTRSGEQLD